MKNKVKCVIFDFDGVIKESADIKSKNFVEIFSDYSVEIQEQILRYHIQNQGVSRMVKIRFILENILGEYTEKLYHSKIAHFESLTVQRVIDAPYIAGAHEYISYLNKHDIPCYVASGTPQEELRTIVSHLSGLRFEGIYGSPRLKENIIYDILRDTGLNENDLLFVGDAITDYNAARGTGIPFVAVQSEVMGDFWAKTKVLEVDNLMSLYAMFHNV